MGTLPALPGSVQRILGLITLAIRGLMRAMHGIAPTGGAFGKVLTLFLILSIVSLTPVFAKGITNITNANTLFDVQQAYGKKVQAKTKVNKQSLSLAKLLLKTNSINKYSSKAAQKQFEVQFKVGNSYNVQQFGAKGDGITDDQNAINQAIARATGTGLSVYFPPGNYLHSSLIVSNGVALFGAGASTILTATDNTNGAIKLTGNGPSLSNVVVQYANPLAIPFPPFPDTTPQYSGIWVQSANK
ncbi:MAG: glycosyl hydrolase family 28-related protein [Minisyncoccia bacterium]